MMQQRIDDSVALLKLHEPEEGYYLAFSGGKDSIVILDLAKKSGVKFEAHYSMTTIDPPEITNFIKDNFPEVIWHRPTISFFKLIEREKVPPTRTKRYCCRVLKEFGGTGRVIVLGLRKQESRFRKQRSEFEKSTKQKGTFFCNPIIEWSEKEVWEYIRSNNLKYCSLYDRGKKRVGCLFCPMQGMNGMEYDRYHYPKYYAALLRALQRMLDHIHKDGGEWRVSKSTPEGVWDWWIGRDETYINRQIKWGFRWMARVTP